MSAHEETITVRCTSCGISGRTKKNHFKAGLRCANCKAKGTLRVILNTKNKIPPDESPTRKHEPIQKTVTVIPSATDKKTTHKKQIIATTSPQSEIRRIPSRMRRRFTRRRNSNDATVFMLIFAGLAGILLIAFFSTQDARMHKIPAVKPEEHTVISTPIMMANATGVSPATPTKLKKKKTMQQAAAEETETIHKKTTAVTSKNLKGQTNPFPMESAQRTLSFYKSVHDTSNRDSAEQSNLTQNNGTAQFSDDNSSTSPNKQPDPGEGTGEGLDLIL